MAAKKPIPPTPAETRMEADIAAAVEYLYPLWQDMHTGRPLPFAAWAVVFARLLERIARKTLKQQIDDMSL